MPPVFAWLAKQGGITPGEMSRVFNCGIGMVVVVDRAAADHATEILSGAGEQVFRIGQVAARRGDAPGCTVSGAERAWA